MKYRDMIRDRIRIEDVVSQFVPSLKRRGSKYWTCCPFHNEKTASFCVNPATGRWHCFGACGEGGDVISFYMKIKGLTFPLAIKEMLREYLHIDIKDFDIQRKPEDEEKDKLKESMFIVNDRLCKWFQEQLQADTAEAKAAKAYAYGRWSEDFCQEEGIGYAPDSWNELVDWARNSSLSIDILLQLGVIKKSEKTGNLYSFYRNRVMIPIRDQYGRVRGFSGRTMDEHEEHDRKYFNSSTSLIYNKDHSVFGICNAMRQARLEEKMILVEGGPDVLRMQMLGILNTVASLGGAWTEHQLSQLRPLHASLCFIPDSDITKKGDKFGTGFLNVMRNGKLAIKQGFTVSVREIPNSTGKKQDPDSYITSKKVFNSMHEEEFILWYAGKMWDEGFLAEERVKFIDDICDLLICIKDEGVQQSYINELVSIYHHKPSWSAGLKAAKLRLQEEQNKKENKNDPDYNVLRKYGFSVNQDCYFGNGKDGSQIQWSNFIFKPHFHIKDDTNPVRIFDIRNNDPDSKPEVIELDMDTLTSSKTLRKKLIGMGNYMWKGDDNSLMQLLSYLIKVTETAYEVKQMGWQKQGFYCFCNGAQEDGVWTPADKMGIVRLKSGNYYIPAMSQLYANSTELFTNERRFIHMNYSDISLRDYLTKIIDVFGDNAKVGICFMLATLFRDIVKSKANFFPILNIFGPKGSGKTQLARSLMTFFMTETDTESLNIESGTLAALSEAVASSSNALVHLDEYKNSVTLKKIEWLKDLWGGIGRFKINMDKDKKREQARVDSGVILTGQEMPTEDIALFTRVVFLTYDKQHHTEEEREKYEDLLHYRKLGATHLTLEILKHRAKFEAVFAESWKKAKGDLQKRLKGKGILDRIEHNWAIPLSAYLALEKTLDLPFAYEDLLEICVDCIMRQNKLCNRTDELAKFWDIISSAQQKGNFREGQDYIIKFKDKLNIGKDKRVYEFNPPRKVLMIRRNSMMATYRQLGKQMDEKMIPQESMLHYLTNTPEYIGCCTDAQRFKRFGSNGLPLQDVITDGKGGIHSTRTIWDRDRPLCFDYQPLSDKYNIILDSDFDDEEANTEQDNVEELTDEEMAF